MKVLRFANNHKHFTLFIILAVGVIAVMYLGNIVEVLPGEDVTEHSRHPYTLALVRAQFSIHMDPDKKIESIESEASSPLDVLDGCPFQNRCDHCAEKCKMERPVLKEINNESEKKFWMQFPAIRLQKSAVIM